MADIEDLPRVVVRGQALITVLRAVLPHWAQAPSPGNEASESVDQPGRSHAVPDGHGPVFSRSGDGGAGGGLGWEAAR